MRIRKSLILVLCLTAVFLQPSLANQANEQDAAWNQLTRGFTVDDEKRVESFPVTGARKFGSDVVVDCHGYKVLDVAKLRLVPLSIPSAKAIHSICDNDGRQYALCSVAHAVVLKVKDGSNWHDIKVPRAVMAKPSEWLVTAGGADVAFVSSDSCYSLRDGEWTKVQLKKGSVFLEPEDKIVMRGDKIYSSFNRGEWGGRINKIDCRTGSC